MTVPAQGMTTTGRSPGRSAGVFGAATSALRTLLQSSLLRNGYALIVNTGLTAVLGLFFWVLAARSYSVEAVGLAGAVIATLVNLSNAAQLNFGNVLIRFVPTAGAHSGRLILFAYGIAGLASVVIAGCFLLFADRFVPELAVISDNPVLASCFIAAVAAWTVFALQDCALSGLRQAVWVPVENSAYSIAKIVLLLPFVAWGWIAIAAAWTLPVLFFIVAVNALIFLRLLPGRRVDSSARGMLDWRVITRFYGWDYLGAVCRMITWAAAPLLVLNAAGAAGNASYYVAWTIYTSLYYVGDSMGISLLAEGSTDRNRLRSLAIDAVVLTVLPLLVLAALIAAFAPLIMGLFGPTYAAEGTPILHVLALTSVPAGLVTIYLATVRARGWTKAVALIEAALMVLVLGIGWSLLDRYGPLGMSIGWLAAYLLVAAGVGIFIMVRNGPASILEGVFEARVSAMRLAAIFIPRRHDTDLRPNPGLDGIGFQAPVLLRAQESLDSARVMETVLSREDGEIVLAHPALRQAGLAAAAHAIGKIHESTGFTAILNEDWVAEWIDRPCETIGLAAHALLLPRRRRDALDVVSREQRRFWLGRTVRLGRCHGRYGPKAIRFRADTDGSSPEQAAEGSLPALMAITGWDDTKSNAPASLDACSLALGMRMMATGEEFGQSVANLVKQPGWSAEEREIIFGGMPSRDGGISTADADAIKAIAMLVWLQRTASNLRSSTRNSRDRLWIASNIDHVLREFVPARSQ